MKCLLRGKKQIKKKLWTQNKFVFLNIFFFYFELDGNLFTLEDDWVEIVTVWCFIMSALSRSPSNSLSEKKNLILKQIY